MDAERNINYTSRDFTGIKEQLIELAKNYFPDTYTDFTATSPGMMFIEMAAYVGDILSFYQDKQLQETYLQYARDPKGLYALAYMMGYRPKVTTVSTTELTVTQAVSAVSSSEGYVPDWSEACRIAANAEIVSSLQGSQTFLTTDPVDFNFSSSVDPTNIIAWYDEGNEDENSPNSFLLEKKVKAYSGTIRSVAKTFGSYQKYPTIEIEDSNIVGILDVTEQGTEEEWTEVPFLGQDTVFEGTINEGADSDTVPYVLRLKKVPKRFVSRFNPKGNLEIQFGAGMYADDMDEEHFLPDPLSLSADIQEMSSDKYDTAYDPSNFLFSKSYGLVPVNTTLVVRYVVGGGVRSNVPANTLTQIGNISVDRPDARLSFTNEEASTGGRDGDSLEEIRENSLRTFAEQKRAVTLRDYNVRALAMPAKFGTVAKVYAMKDSLFGGDERDPLNISLYLLSYDTEGHLVSPNDTLKQNLKTYLSEYVMLTDTVDLKDAYVINIGVKYDIVLRQGYSSVDVLLRCNRVLQDYFKTSNRALNEVINLVNLQNLLNQVQGVQVVKDLQVENRVGLQDGREYSEYSYDISAATRNGIVYPSYDISFFEVKYPEQDIEGRIVTM